VLPFVLHKIIAPLKEADSYKRAIDFPEFIQFSFFSALKNKVIKSSSSFFEGKFIEQITSCKAN
jgi:hypothetical protein